MSTGIDYHLLAKQAISVEDAAAMAARIAAKAKALRAAAESAGATNIIPNDIATLERELVQFRAELAAARKRDRNSRLNPFQSEQSGLIRSLNDKIATHESALRTLGKLRAA